MSNKFISEFTEITSPQLSGNTIYDDGVTTYKMSLETLINVIGTKLINVTYSELTSNITGSTLVSGTYYNITDFRTCYDQPDFNSNGNSIIGDNYKQSEVEPIIVFATSANTISTTAYQPKYPKDRIQYDWTFSTTERTSGVAYGRISERIDEFNNRTDYDHRTILFKRYRYYELSLDNPYQGTVEVINISGTIMTVSGTGTNFLSSVGLGNKVGFEPNNNDYRVYEVISIDSDTGMTITGLTTTSKSPNTKMYYADWEEYSSFYQNNVDDPSEFEEYYTFFTLEANNGNGNINNYIGNYGNFYQWNENDFILANNVFQNRFQNNKFGDNCYNNTFFDDCESNIIGNFFSNNITDDDFDGNVIGNLFNNNKITSNFQYNRIGENFQYNYLVQNSFYRNNIMNDFRNNEISGGDFQNNEIGSQFNNNVIRNGQFYKNDIGNGYNYNKVYSDFYGNLIGNGFANNNIYCQFYENTIGERFGAGSGGNTIGDINNPGNGVFNDNKIGNAFRSNTIITDFYKNEIGPDFYNNGISGETYTNRIGEQFENNTIYSDFYDNQIFNEFKGNITYQSFTENRVDWGFTGNQFSGSCSNNSFGSTIVSNDFLGIVFGNIFKGAVYENTIGDNFAANNIGFGFGDNIIGENFGYGAGEPQGNTIGNGFTDNNVGEYFYNNIIPDNFHDNEIGNYFQWNVINTNIDNTYFTLNYGNITGFSYTASGTGATDTIYTNLTGTTNGHGVSATFDVEVSGGTVTGISGNTEGRLYFSNDTLTILGTQIGGVTPADNVVITVTGVTSGSLFYDHYTKQIFERKGGDKRVSFYDENDILNLDSIYINSGYIPVYSQSLTFPIPYASFEFWCDGGYSNNGGTTSQTVNNVQELVTLFNNIYRQFGYFFDNNDGTLGLYINPSLKEQYCPNGTYTINVFNND